MKIVNLCQEWRQGQNAMQCKVQIRFWRRETETGARKKRSTVRSVHRTYGFDVRSKWWKLTTVHIFCTVCVRIWKIHRKRLYLCSKSHRIRHKDSSLQAFEPANWIFLRTETWVRKSEAPKVLVPYVGQNLIFGLSAFLRRSQLLTKLITSKVHLSL